MTGSDGNGRNLSDAGGRAGPPAPVEPGVVLSGCRVVSEIGRGGMGIVYRAIDERLQRRVAIKFLHRHLADSQGRDRFLREAAAMAQFDHPGIARIFASAEYLAQPYYVMEFLDGEDLEACLRRAVALRETPGALKEAAVGDASTTDTASFLRAGLPAPSDSAPYLYHVNTATAAMADALHHAHAHGIIHRDVKPSNVQVCASGAIKLLDFGLAATISPGTLTSDQAFLGTVTYMAPERFQPGYPRADCRMDIYALGIVYFQLLTLRHPVTAPDLTSAIGQILRGNFEDPRVLNPAIPPATAEIVARCLAVEPSARFDSAEALADAVRAQTVVSRSGSRPLSHPVPAELTVALEPDAVPARPRSPVPPAIAAMVADLRERAARDLFTNLDPTLALDRLQQAMELDPDDVDVRLLLCRVLSWVGDRRGYAREVAALRARRTALNEVQQLRLDLFTAAVLERDLKKAQGPATKLLARLHFDELVWRVTSDALIKQGRLKEAMAQATAAVRDHPEIVSGWMSLAMLCRTFGDHEGARDVHERFVAAHPNLPAGHVMMVSHLLLQGDFERAGVHVRRALELEPMNADALHQLALLHIEAGDLAAALAATRMVISVTPHDAYRAHHYMTLCQLHEELGETEKARACLAIARAQAPDHSYRSREELRSLLARTDLGSMYADAVLPQDQDTVDAEVKEACLESVRLGGSPGDPQLEYYAVDESGRVLHVLITPQFNSSSRLSRDTVMLLCAMPVLPFVDEEGRILAVKYDRVEGLAGSFLAKISYHSEHAPGTFRFLLSGLPGDGLVETRGRTLRVRTRGDTNRTRRVYRLLISVPRGLWVERWSEEPARVVEGAQRTIGIFRRRLKASETYPVIHVDLTITDTPAP
jgi:serine/threonine protein kinase/Flp pilus assembly protein TadD